MNSSRPDEAVAGATGPELVAHRGAVVGIDIGGTKIAAAIVHASGSLEGRTTAPTPREGPEAISRRTAEIVDQLLTGAVEVSGIGIGLPGVVDSSRGLAVSAANLPWSNTPFGRELEERFGLPTYLENDANAGALGEKWFGQGREAQSFIYLSIGTGIGSGIVVGNRLLPGRNGKSSEIGHTIVELEGPECRCGNRGCLEALSSGTAIAHAMRDRFGRHVTAQAALAAAAAGDAEAGTVLAQAARYLAVAIINAWRLLTPELIILGGGVAEAGDPFLEPLTNAIESLSVEGREITSRLRLSRLEGSSGVLGAGAVALERLSADPGAESRRSGRSKLKVVDER